MKRKIRNIFYLLALSSLPAHELWAAGDHGGAASGRESGVGNGGDTVICIDENGDYIEQEFLHLEERQMLCKFYPVDEMMVDKDLIDEGLAD